METQTYRPIRVPSPQEVFMAHQISAGDSIKYLIIFSLVGYMLLKFSGALIMDFQAAGKFPDFKFPFLSLALDESRNS